MGYNATIMVLMDRWHEVVNNPELWVQSIDDNLREGGTAHFQTTVMRQEHADIPRLYFSQANWMHEFDPYDRDLFARIKENPRMVAILKEDVRMSRDMLDNFEKKLLEIESP